MVAKSTISKPATTKVPVKPTTKVVEFVNSAGTEVDHITVNNWIRDNCGNNPNHVVVVPLDNADLSNKEAEMGKRKAFPFGYSRPGGTRALFHDWHAFGVEGDFRLGNMLDHMNKVDKHSKSRKMCTVALLNGGYTRSCASWGTPFIKLVYRPA